MLLETHSSLLWESGLYVLVAQRSLGNHPLHSRQRALRDHF
jgi:hypothetical protein